MKTNHIISILLLSFIMLYACSDDEPSEMVDDDPIGQTDDDPMPDPDPEPDTSVQDSITAVDAARDSAFDILTGGSSTVWRIESAELVNDSGSIDITDNFNVADDEFIFSIAQNGKSQQRLGTIEWRPSYDVVFNSADSDGSLPGRYIPPVKSEFEIGPPVQYTAGEPIPIRIEHGSNFTRYFYENWIITEFDNGSRGLSGSITVENEGSMQFNLVPKDEDDYKQVPSATLNFTEALTFESNAVDGFATGMVGSLASNSMYISMREGAFNNGTANPERVIRISLDTNTANEKLNFTSDFVSKELQIIGDQLYVAGGQRMHAYDLALANDPILVVDYAQALGLNFIGLTRFGTAVQGDDIYLIGGDLDNTFSNKVLKYSLADQTLTEFAELPEPRFGARAEIVNDKLYIFGGTESFSAPPSKTTIYIVDLATGLVTTENMPVALDYTFTGKIENLIYVGGAIRVVDGQGIQTNREPYLGVYDTRTGTFTELQTNLASPDLETIQSLAVFKNQLYVILGQGQAQDPGVLQTWSILSADI